MGGAGAQHVMASLAAGAVSLRFTGQESVVAATISPALRLRSTHAALGIAGTVSQVDPGRWSSQGTLVGSLFSPVVGTGWLGEASVVAGGSTFPGISTSQVVAGLRVHRLGVRAAGWMGASAGTMHDGVAARAVRQLDLGVNWLGERATLSAVASPTVTDDTLHYTDLFALVATSRGPFDAIASLGARAGAALPIPGGDRRIWGGLSVNTWLGEYLALTVGVGTYPVDVTQGFPAGRYVALGLRVGASRAPRAVEYEARRALRREARAAGVTAFELGRISAGMVELRVRAPAAGRVEVTGDLTGWRPVALVPGSDGWWTGRFPSTSRMIELVLRVGDGPWIIPPGAEVSTDEFGGRSGRVVVP